MRRRGKRRRITGREGPIATVADAVRDWCEDDRAGRRETDIGARSSGGRVVEREVVSIVWHRTGHHIWLTFIEGDVKHFVGSESYAGELAAMAGLNLVYRGERTVRWAGDRELWSGELPISS